MASERQTVSTSALARALLDLCRSRKLTIATAESCTGGLVAAALTEIPEYLLRWCMCCHTAS